MKICKWQLVKTVCESPREVPCDIVFRVYFLSRLGKNFHGVRIQLDREFFRMAYNILIGTFVLIFEEVDELIITNLGEMQKKKNIA